MQSPAHASAPRAFLWAFTRVSPAHALLVMYCETEGAWLSAYRRGSISNLQGGWVLPRSEAPLRLRLCLPYLPPSTAPLLLCAISITITRVKTWRKRRAFRAGADFGRQRTTAATRAAQSPRGSCRNYPSGEPLTGFGWHEDRSRLEQWITGRGAQLVVGADAGATSRAAASTSTAAITTTVAASTHG
jgi:hypothetical protein